MLKDDQIRLRHMLDAAREAVSFSRGRTRKDLETDRRLVLSLVKDIEIVGEAAAQITVSIPAASLQFVDSFRQHRVNPRLRHR